MNKLYFVLIATVVLIFMNSNTQAQPKLTLNVTAGYSQPMGDFNNGFGINDTVPDSWPYLMRSGYNIGVTGKYIVNKKKNIKVVLALNYNGFKNWGDLAVTSDNGSGFPTTDTVQFLPKVAILALSVGGEYSFNPKATFNPFAGLDFTTNFFSGSYQSNPSSNFQKSQLKAETRFGLNIGGGVDYNISKYVGAIFGAKYCFANLIGKGGESDVESYQVALNDESNGLQDSRNISYFQFYAGVSFFFQNPF